MDPLTHTLVGANLAATRLGKKTPMAVAALVAGANLPDLDILSYAVGGDFALGFRRGWTHGLPAVAVLPFLLTGVLLLWDRLGRRRRSHSSPPRLVWLVALSALAVATHPALDWLNTYGMRWLMPFRGEWSYGDSVFIMDPWLWLLLGGAWLLGRRPSAPLVSVWGLSAGALTLMTLVAGASRYLPVLSAVAAALLAALLWKRFAEPETAHRLARGGLALAAAYIAGMLALHALTTAQVRANLERLAVGPVQRLMVGPRPCDPLSWDVLAELPDRYRYGRFCWLRAPGLELAPGSLLTPNPSPHWTTLQARPEVAGFLTWARFPWYESEPSGRGLRLYLMDARYARRRTLGFGGTLLELEGAAPSGRGSTARPRQAPTGGHAVSLPTGVRSSG